MFKLNKIYILIFIFILMILSSFSVCYAETSEESQRADISNIAFEWAGYDEASHTTLHLKVKNVTLINDNNYYVHVSHNKDEKLNVTDWESLDTDNVWNKIIWKDDNTIYDLQDIVAEKGDIYIWICEFDSDFIPKIVVEARKIERLEQLPFGTRLDAHFFNDVTHIYSCEPEGNKDRKVNVKIGTVADKSILQAIKNKETNSLQKLLIYAKSADAIYNDTLPLGDSKQTILGSGNIINNEYYYVYMELDDENGTYYPVEDVSLYQSYGSGLYNYLDNSFIWNLEDDTAKPNEENKDTQQKEDESKNPSQIKAEVDNTTAKGILPQTGQECVMVSVLFVFIVFLIIAGVKLKNIKI